MVRRALVLVLPLTLAAAVACGSAQKAPAAAVASASPPVATALPSPSASASTPALAPPPPTPKVPAFDTYFGTQVEDDYRWLEDFANPDVKAWSDAQNQYARAFLDGLALRPAVRARVDAVLSKQSPSYRGVVQRGGLLFAMKNQPPKQQPMLVVVGSDADVSRERVLVDPNALDTTGKTTLDFFVPNGSGTKIAVSLSQGGTEHGDVHVLDVGTGKETGDVVPHVNGGTAGGSLAWTNGGAAFYYTRYPHDGERAPEDLDFYQEVYFHKLGTPASADTYAIGKELPRIAETHLASSDDGRWVLASVENGDSDTFWHYLRGPSGTWTKIADLGDHVARIELGHDGALYAISRDGAPRGKVLRMPAASADLTKATVLVPEGDAVIAAIVPGKSVLYVAEVEGGPSRLRYVFLGTGKEGAAVPIEPVSTVGGMTIVGGDELLYESTSYLTPPACYRASPSAAPEKTSLAQTPTVDLSAYEAVRDTCTSKDGTQVPMSIVRKKGTLLDGSNATLLTGYGGFGIVRSPVYTPSLVIWLEQGGVFANGNLRGGGELGEEWHRDGSLTKKQNVFDDFYACAHALVDRGYTKPERLAAQGGSNGGLLMGALVTQHPDAVKAVVSRVGYYDMLRFETASNGVFHTTEYGSVKDPAQFAALYAYSPYQHVTDGTPYPAILFMTGANDPRVNPFHSRKMTARLQAASSSAQPILLRTSANTGHGMGTPLAALIEESADAYSFLFDRLGVAYQAPQ